MFALIATGVIATIGLGIDVIAWYRTDRALQNAADAAAVAAARNATSSYQSEAGAVSKSSNGASCFGLVVGNTTINGTGEILKTGGCVAAGLNLLSNTVGTVALVQ